MRFSAAIAALILGCSSAAAAAPSGKFDETAFWSRVKIDPALPEPLRARTAAAVKRLLGAPSLRERAQTLALAEYDVLITTCAREELSAGPALPYGVRIGGTAGYPKGEVKEAFDDARFPNFRVCWDENDALPIPGRRGGLPESTIAHELFGHAATNTMRVKAFIPALAMAFRSENELNAYMIEAVAMRELGYPYAHPFSGKKPAGLAAYEQEVVFSKPYYARLLTARDAADPLKAYEKRLPRWTKACREGLLGGCAAAKELEKSIASLRTESGRAAFGRHVASPGASDFNAELLKESEALRRKLAALGSGYDNAGMLSYDQRQDEMQFGAPIPTEDAR